MSCSLLPPSMIDGTVLHPSSSQTRAITVSHPHRTSALTVFCPHRRPFLQPPSTQTPCLHKHPILAELLSSETPVLIDAPILPEPLFTESPSLQPLCPHSFPHPHHFRPHGSLHPHRLVGLLQGEAELIQLQSRAVSLLIDSPPILVEPLVSIFELQDPAHNLLRGHIQRLQQQGKFREVSGQGDRCRGTQSPQNCLLYGTARAWPSLPWLVWTWKSRGVHIVLPYPHGPHIYTDPCPSDPHPVSQNPVLTAPCPYILHPHHPSMKTPILAVHPSSQPSYLEEEIPI